MFQISFKKNTVGSRVEAKKENRRESRSEKTKVHRGPNSFLKGGLEAIRFISKRVPWARKGERGKSREYKVHGMKGEQ